MALFHIQRFHSPLNKATDLSSSTKQMSNSSPLPNEISHINVIETEAEDIETITLD